MIEEQIKMIKNLKAHNILTNQEILNIIEAFQIASAQGYAIMKTKGILDYLKNNGEIYVENTFLKQKQVIKNIYDLSMFYKEIDQNIDLEKDVTFSTYFEK